jgi:FtsH-binding integral membrane protein
MYYNRYENTVSVGEAQSQASTIFLAKVFNWMAIGLGITGLLAFLVANTPAALEIFIVNPLIRWGIILGELGLVFYLSARIQKISAVAATYLFLIYSALNGITLSVVLLIYTATSVTATFFITAGMFAAMAVYGLVTKRDLSGLGSFMFMGLIGMIIASVVNIFLQSSMMAWVVSGVGVLVFTGLTAYDVQKITQIGASGIMQEGEAAIRKGAIIGALALYLDFINLFISLLHFLGVSRD